jgi:hypothetical protein
MNGDTRETDMAAKKSGAKKYGKKAARKVATAMHEMKQGTLRSGRSGRKATKRKQAIAIGLSEARRSGTKVPAKRGAAKKRSAKKRSSPKRGSRPRGGSKHGSRAGHTRRPSKARRSQHVSPGPRRHARRAKAPEIMSAGGFGVSLSHEDE